MINKKQSGKISIIVYVVIFLLIIIAGILNLVINKKSAYYDNKEIAINKCIQECHKANAKDIILTEGPCLSEKIIEGWACDIINDPKIDIIDNNPKNQCESYIKKDVKNIVYLNQNCGLVSTK